MQIQTLTQFRDKLQALVDSHPEHLQEAFATCDISHEDSSALQKEYERKVNPYRQLHIGIVGRVKAGKSSLLNSLFFEGKDVLPKAATPMTAALTKLYYSEKLTVRINFFEQSDIDELAKAHSRYERLLEAKVNEKFETLKSRNRQNLSETELMVKAKKSSLNELKTDNLLLVGEAEQYQLYLKSSTEVKAQLGKPIELYPDDIYSIGSKLADYVGADGKYTGITSNVEIGFPNEILKEITVVDTPGFDDPVPSRDALARDALRVCDAIFVLSPAGSFCNAEDKVNIAKIEKGEGIQEIFIVASQIDSSLRANEYMGNSIPENLKSITESISKTLKNMLDGMKAEGIASLELIERLSQSTGKNLLYTSGMCQSLYENWDNKSEWGEELTWLFSQLKESYPEYFSSEDDTAKEMLKKIGNVNVIRDKINEVRCKKDEILKSRENDFIQAKNLSLKDSVTILLDTIKNQKSRVESGDIGELKKAQDKQRECLENLKADFIETFDSLISDFSISASSKLQQVVNELYSDKKSEMKHAEGSEEINEQYTVKVPYQEQIAKEGLFNSFARFFGFGGFETVTNYRNEERERTVILHTINAHEVAAAIKDFADLTGNVLENNAQQIKIVFKNNLKHSLMDIWAKYEVVDYCSNSTRSIQAAQIVSLIPDVNFIINWTLPNNINRGGTLKNDEAYNFEHEAFNALSDLRNTYLKSISEFSTNVSKSLVSVKLTEMILKKMSNDIEDLTAQIQNKEKTLETFDSIQKEIELLQGELS